MIHVVMVICNLQSWKTGGESPGRHERFHLFHATASRRSSDRACTKRSGHGALPFSSVDHRIVPQMAIRRRTGQSGHMVRKSVASLDNSPYHGADWAAVRPLALAARGPGRPAVGCDGGGRPNRVMAHRHAAQKVHRLPTALLRQQIEENARLLRGSQSISSAVTAITRTAESHHVFNDRSQSAHRSTVLPARNAPSISNVTASSELSRAALTQEPTAAAAALRAIELLHRLSRSQNGQIITGQLTGAGSSIRLGSP